MPHFCNTTLPDSIKTIGKFTFSSSGLATIDLNNVETLGQQSFGSSNLTEITIPGTVKVIPEECFIGCRLPTDITPEEGVDDLPEFDPEAFVGMYIIGQVYFEKEVIDEHMDELDAFFMGMENMSDKSYYDYGSHYYWITG